MLGEWGGLGSSDGGLGSQGGGLHVWAFGWGVAYSTVAVTQLRAGLIPVPALPPIACLSATAWWVARGPAPPPKPTQGFRPRGSVLTLSICQQTLASLLSCSLLEESYVMKDPFTPDKDRFLILGSRCTLCSRLVCVGPVGKPCAVGSLPSLPPCGRGPTCIIVGESRVSLSQEQQESWPPLAMVMLEPSQSLGCRGRG